MSISKPLAKIKHFNSDINCRNTTYAYEGAVLGTICCGLIRLFVWVKTCALVVGGKVFQHERTYPDTKISVELYKVISLSNAIQ